MSSNRGERSELSNSKISQDTDGKNVQQKQKDDEHDFQDSLDFSKTLETECGLGCGKWKALQRLANQSTFVVIYGLTGCVMSMTYAYFNGTITTLEKRFHLSSRNIGITQIGNDVMSMVTSLVFIHHIRKQHRPRWMAIGVSTIFLFCLMITLPHWLYGPGEDALKLTTEFRGSADEKTTKALNRAEDMRNLCSLNVTTDPCAIKGDHAEVGHPMTIFFVSQLISGFGWSLYYALGYAYMDDNVERSKTAAMYSFSQFLNLLGPSCGYTLASFCLRYYISPVLTPVIDNKDPRWIGAWWLGWLIFGGLLFILLFLLGMFPKELPLNRKQKEQSELLLKKYENLKSEPDSGKQDSNDNRDSSFREQMHTFKRILRNKVFMCNNIASIFYYFGYMPYWTFAPKYLEIVFRQTASESNIYTGTVALVFTAVGVLASGAVISHKKPRARLLAGWNAFTGLLTVAGFLSYSLIGCSGNENSLFFEQSANDLSALSFGCAEACHCEFVPYAPVCGENNSTYISACHAGCRGIRLGDDGKEQFYDCDCVAPLRSSNDSLTRSDFNNSFAGGIAAAGACSVDCFDDFLVFLAIMCTLKFFGSTTRASYFLIQVRSVEVEDKTVALGLSMVMVSLLSFIPSPIFFGWLLDQMCLVWGKTCSKKNNCWIYDSRRLRHTLNYTASAFLFMGALCDCLNCYLVKDLKIFDDGDQKAEEEKIVSTLELSKLGAKK